MALFASWFDAAREDDAVIEPNAMALATSGKLAPSVRMVLLKAFDPATASFTWFTNLESRKAREIASGAHAALCWWWPGAGSHQVRAVGRTEPVDRASAQAYFASREPAARIGASSSRQSRPVATREEFDGRVAAVGPAPTAIPSNWGGITLVADELEFWQGRAGRLHDRITFLRLDSDGAISSTDGFEAAGGESALRDAAVPITDPYGTRWLRARLEP